MEQNTIAIVWDFDKTLIKGYMQDPIFKKFSVDATAFWKEVNSLPEEYRKQGVKVNTDTIYLNHMLTCVGQGIFKGLNNDILTELGQELEFYNGIPDIFRILKEAIASDPSFSKFGIHVEHYIVSTGITAMIRGSKISKYVDGIWGCEFIEEPIISSLEIKIANEPKSTEKEIQQVGYIIDNTSKTRAVFEINKGVNKFDYIDVNGRIDPENRRVPFEHMIYVADGPSDVPVFSVLQQYGGRTFAIYPKGDTKAFNQVDQLRKDGRIDMYAEADYSEESMACMWLLEQTKAIAQVIYANHDEEIRKSASIPPKHLST